MNEWMNEIKTNKSTESHVKTSLKLKIVDSQLLWARKDLLMFKIYFFACVGRKRKSSKS